MRNTVQQQHRQRGAISRAGSVQQQQQQQRAARSSKTLTVMPQLA
jgi:hypothetical protein